MTRRRGINSKYAAKDFLQRGLRSMFPNYPAEAAEPDATKPVDTEKDGKRRLKG